MSNITIESFDSYRYTKDYVFVIEPSNHIDKNTGKEIENDNENKHADSPFLCIRKKEHDTIINIDNPPDDYAILSNFIKKKFIILDETEREKIINFAPLSKGNEYEFEYYKYKFFRKILDKRPYNKKGKPIDKDPTLLNENDCLKFAECATVFNQKFDNELFEDMITAIDPFDDGKGVEPVLQVEENKETFGESYDKNKELANSVSLENKNFNANPKVGQCYAFVNSDIDGTPYHIAFVMCKHKNLNITIEAFADSGNNPSIKFAFYDTIKQKHTFHQYYKYSFPEIQTIVLESRDLNNILDKLKQDIKDRAVELEGVLAKKTAKPLQKTSLIRPSKSVRNPKKRLASVSASRNASVHKSARKSLKPSMSKKDNTNTRRKITKNRQV